MPQNVGHQTPSDVASHSRTGTSDKVHLRYRSDVFFVCADKSYEKYQYIQSLSEPTFELAESQMQVESAKCSMTIFDPKAFSSPFLHFVSVSGRLLDPKGNLHHHAGIFEACSLFNVYKFTPGY